MPASHCRRQEVRSPGPKAVLGGTTPWVLTRPGNTLPTAPPPPKVHGPPSSWLHGSTGGGRNVFHTKAQGGLASLAPRGSAVRRQVSAFTRRVLLQTPSCPPRRSAQALFPGLFLHSLAMFSLAPLPPLPSSGCGRRPQPLRQAGLVIRTRTHRAGRDISITHTVALPCGTSSEQCREL